MRNRILFNRYGYLISARYLREITGITERQSHTVKRFYNQLHHESLANSGQFRWVDMEMRLAKILKGEHSTVLTILKTKTFTAKAQRVQRVGRNLPAFLNALRAQVVGFFNKQLSIN